MTDSKKQLLQDEALSEFTDRTLQGQMKNTASDSSDELRGLEETILRLHSTMPSTALEESTKKQMLVRLNARIRREKEQPQRTSIWATLTNGVRNLSRPQFAIAIGFISLLVAAVIFAPSFGTGDSSTTVGTALDSNSNIFLVLGLIAVIIGVLWSVRRK